MASSSVYLDHYTRVGALRLLQNPSKNFNVFTLLDLITCTEAFVLYDEVLDLYGSSSFAMESYALSTDSAISRQMLSLKQDIITRGYTKKYSVPWPQIIKGYWYWETCKYFVPESFTDIVLPVLAELFETYPDSILSLGYININEPKSVTNFTLRILDYMLHSVLLKASYYSSAIRSPLVSLLRNNINYQVFDVINTIKDSMEEIQARKLDYVKTRFYDFEISLAIPPIFRLVLQECQGPDDFLRSVMDLRRSQQTRSFRNWMVSLQAKVNSGKVSEIEEVVSEIENLQASFLNSSHNHTPLALGFFPKAITKFPSRNLISMLDFLIQPHVIFVKRLVQSLQSIEKDIELIEEKLGVRVSSKLLDDIEWLQKFQQNIDNLNVPRAKTNSDNDDVSILTSKKGNAMIPILFLAADPTDASRLRLGEEYREIQEKLKLAKLRDNFKLELPQLSIRPADISQAMLDVEPQIVHFSGHGTPTGALCFESQTGQAQLIQSDALAALFEQFASQVNCVVLNACYSETQAKAIAEHIEYVIGMNKEIGDKAAVAFAIGFYQALGAGRTVEEAYKLGCVQIRLQGIPEHLTPVLIKKE